MKTVKPRNPMIPALHQRSGAGAHQKTNKAQRQAARQQFKRSLKREEGFVQSTAAVR